jgi:hypothetical protein
MARDHQIFDEERAVARQRLIERLVELSRAFRSTGKWRNVMRTSAILLLNSYAYPKRRIFVSNDKAIALISSILAAAVIATALVASAVAGLKQGEGVLNPASGGALTVERQITRGGSFVGYT